jgi:Fe-S-cluster containining protein
MVDWDKAFDDYYDRSVAIPLRFNPFSIRRCHDLLKCEQCGACCHYAAVPVGKHDIERAPEIAPYVKDGKLITKGGCPMLVDNKCSIYERRPDTCWLFPLQTPTTVELDGKKTNLILVRLKCRAALNVAKAILLEAEKDGQLEVQQNLSLRRVPTGAQG